MLDIGQLREVGKKVKDEQRQLYQAKVDHNIMRLICVRGLVPNVIDSPEWKELMCLLNGTYHPTSATTFADKHIPREAVHVREKQIEALRKANNLTLTFDGNTTRKPESLYTAHATTPSRETYFLGGHEGSDEHHTKEWVKDKLLKVRNFLDTWGSQTKKCARLYILSAKPIGRRCVQIVQMLRRLLAEILLRPLRRSLTFVMRCITSKT